MTLRLTCAVLGCLLATGLTTAQGDQPFVAFAKKYCADCHNETVREGNLDLAELPTDLTVPGGMARWTRIHDRLQAGEMPPADSPRPAATELAPVVEALADRLTQADQAHRQHNGRAPLRRLTRSEYEHTVGDLLAISGAELAHLLPPDGRAHGTVKHADALDLSYVQIRQYMAAAEQALNWAIVTFPTPPPNGLHRSGAQEHHGLTHGMYNGDAHLITADKQRDPRVPLPKVDLPKETREHWVTSDFFEAPRSVGILRNADGYDPTLRLGTTLPGRYRIRASHWSFLYDKGVIKPTDQPQIAALQLKNDLGERVLHYCDALPMKNTITEFEVFLSEGDRFGWTASSLYPVRVSEYKDKGQGYTGPGIALDWIEIEGPLFDTWPPESHRRLFGELPLEPLSSESGKRLPPRNKFPDHSFLLPKIPRFPVGNREIPLHAAENHRDHGPFTPTTQNPREDAERLLSAFLRRAYRGASTEDDLAHYLAMVETRLAADDCFENAMRHAYQAILCSVPFLYRMEHPGPLNDHALATRLSYFLWNSTPDDTLLDAADAGNLTQPDGLRQHTERMIDDPRFARFVGDFTDQWLALDEIDATTPDKMLYPEFRPFLADLMVAETRAYVAKMIADNRPAWEFIESDWAMLNQGVAELYGIEGVVGADCQRVALPQDSPRGGLLAQASLLKVSADGTSTTPVRRGVFVLERLLGIHPAPPPPNISGVEPDVRGAVTIREILAKHRDHASCASCHRVIDPPGFALEGFDPIGQARQRYRSTETGDRVELTYPNTRRARWLEGPTVDTAGSTPEGTAFDDLASFRTALRATGYERHLARNLLERFAIYATGAEIRFADRAEIERLLDAWSTTDYAMRDLIHLVVQSDLFQQK